MASTVKKQNLSLFFENIHKKSLNGDCKVETDKKQHHQDDVQISTLVASNKTILMFDAFAFLKLKLQ